MKSYKSQSSASQNPGDEKKDQIVKPEEEGSVFKIYKFKHHKHKHSHKESKNSKKEPGTKTAVLHHSLTDESKTSASTCPFELSIPANDHAFLTELSKKKERRTNKDKKYDDHNVEFNLERPSPASLRQLLLKAGFVPNHCNEMVEFYNALVDDESQILVQKTESDINLEEQRQAAAAFAGPSTSTNSRNAGTTSLAKSKIQASAVSQQNDHGQVEKEPSPETFIHPKTTISLARKEKLVESHLNKEKSVVGRSRGPRMRSMEYDERKRLLMNAALRRYDRELEKPTDEILHPLIKDSEERIIYHNIGQHDIESDLNLIDFGITDHASTDNAHENYGSIFTGHHPHSERPLDHFEGSIMGSVLKEVKEEDSPMDNNKFKQSLQTLKTPNRLIDPLSPKERREIARQTLNEYELTKQRHLNSTQRPKALKLISPSSAAPAKQNTQWPNKN